MSITLEQARALEALAAQGTFEAAAKALRKGHTAVVYALRTMEEQLGLTLLDRHAYRTKLTPAGERVLASARTLLEAAHALDATCSELRTGWEPRVRLVFDGIFPAEVVLRVVRDLVSAQTKTRIDVRTAFLGGVEEAFEAADGDLMISVVPVRAKGLDATPLAPLRARLVAHADHRLVRTRGGPHDARTLADEVLLTVRGSDPRLELPTAAIEPSFSVELHDFHAKKAAILSKMGYGWLPEHVMRTELRRGLLREVRWTGASEHAFTPTLYRRSKGTLGRAGQTFFTRLSPKT